MEEDNITIANMDKHRTILNMHSMDKYENTSLYNNCNNDNRVHRHSRRNSISSTMMHISTRNFIVRSKAIQSRHLPVYRCCLIDFLNCHTLLIELFEKNKCRMGVDEQMTTTTTTTTTVSQHSSQRLTVSLEREYVDM